MRLWPATLYGSLEELLARGWIRELAGHERLEGTVRIAKARLGEEGA